MDKVVISVLGGVASIEFQTDGIDVSIFDMDSEETYLYKDEYVCIVTDINTDGTVNIKTIGNISGKKDRRIFLDIPSEELEYYNSSCELDEYITEEVG